LLTFLKENRATAILMLITAVLITVSSVLVNQSFLRVLPLYVSLIIALLQSRANRLAPLLGGINSLLYAVVYFHYNLLAMAVYAIVISCPIQLLTFVRWTKHSYADSTQFRRLSVRGRVLVTAMFAGAWLILCGVLWLFDSSYMLFDNTITLLGILISILTMLAYIEYAWLMLPSGIISILLYVVMLPDSPEQLPYLIFSVYSMICVVRGFFRVLRLYDEQRAQQQFENNNP